MVQTINAETPLAEARAILGATYGLHYSPAVQKATAPLFDRLKDRIPAVEWPFFAPLIVAINELKGQRDAIILAHAYQTPEIFHGVADITGDAVTLAAAAERVSQAVIVQCGVRFMAETSKILNPGKTVLIPDGRAGCSLAASITADDVLALKARYPDVPVVVHLNTSAAVKAVSDVCCTSANALAIVEAVSGDTVILVPDQFLAQDVARRTKKKIITWAGSCEVHRTFSATDIAELRAAYPTARIIAHRQCPPDVAAAVDFSGGITDMIDWVKAEKPARVVMVTECSVSDNLATETEGTEFLRGCNICPHMKRITLENILWSLHAVTEKVSVDAALIDPATQALHRMMELGGTAA